MSKGSETATWLVAPQPGHLIRFPASPSLFRLAEAGAPEPFTPGEAARQEPESEGLPRMTMKEARDRAVEQAERAAIVGALAGNRHNRTRAARALGVSYRTLLRKIQRYDIEVWTRLALAEKTREVPAGAVASSSGCEAPSSGSRDCYHLPSGALW